MKILASVLTSSSRSAVIGDALRSVAWVDEVHVCHFEAPGPGSDDTLQVAEAAAGSKLRVIPMALAPLEELRNEVLDDANRSDATWLVFLDTDERIVANGANVRQLVSQVPAHVSVLSVRMTSGVDSKPMFYRLPTKHRFKGICHEELDGYAPFELPRIRYWEVFKSPEVLHARVSGDVDNLAWQTEAEPGNPRWPFKRGWAQLYLEDFESAALSFAEAARLHAARSQTNAAAYCHYCQADALLQAGQFERALQAASMGWGLAKLPELACITSEVQFECGRAGDSLAWARKAVLLASGAPRTGAMNPFCRFDMPYILQAQAHSALGVYPAERRARADAARAERRRIAWAQKGK